MAGEAWEWLWIAAYGIHLLTRLLRKKIGKYRVFRCFEDTVLYIGMVVLMVHGAGLFAGGVLVRGALALLGLTLRKTFGFPLVNPRDAQVSCRARHFWDA